MSERARSVGREGSMQSAASISSAASLALRPAAVSANPAAVLHFVNTPAAVLVVLNTVVGGGISLIATPYAVKQLGLASFLVGEAFFSFLTCVSLHLLAVVATQLRCYNFQDLLVVLVGQWAGVTTSAAIFLNNLGIVVLFLQTAFDIADVYCHSRQWARLILAGCVVCVLPMAAEPHVDRLAVIASACAALSVAFCLILIANSVDAAASSELSHDWEWSVSAVDVLFSKGIPAINLSWTCQFNAVPLFGSLLHCNVGTMDRVSFLSCISAGVLYSVFGAAVYLYFGSSIDDDVMKNIDPDRGGQGLTWPKWTSLLTEGVLGASVLFTVPLFAIECRNMGHILVTRSECTDTRVRWFETALLLAVCYGVAVGVSDLGLVLAIVGVLPANVVAWLLPGIAILGLLRMRAKNRGEAESDSEKSPCLSVTSGDDEDLPHTAESMLAAGGWLCIGAFCVMLPLGLVSIFK
eukprot:TRINITY_DN2971_c0_g1_i1.p1 TRINITY_DN2971_c0_g1~~TRINITY_DN2971_c0_g1_i1.p1  ORF type:complete len:466 (+),score=90.72 TRINITY_DN2971_c0_g1_i1:215-1612(+)